MNDRLHEQGAGLVFRLGRVLARQKDHEGSYSKLEASIAAVWREHMGPTSRPVIERRKLAALAEHADDPTTSVTISTRQLRALDLYLERWGEGLAHRPLFSRPSLVRELADGGEVVFLVGSKVHDGRVDLSQWDVQAVAELQRGMNRATTTVRYDLLDVLLEEEPDAARGYADESWAHVLDDHGPSVVCVGSPRAVHAAEVMLSRFAGLDPFLPSPAHDEAIPFHFVRPAVEEEAPVPSRFVWHADDIRSFDATAAAEVDKGAHALCLGRRVLLADRLDRGLDRVRTFGIFAAQRRSPGRVWTVVAGLTGAATHACAQVLAGLRASLPADGAGPSAVLWGAVEAVVEEDPRRPGRGVYKVQRHGLLDGPHRWDV